LQQRLQMHCPISPNNIDHQENLPTYPAEYQIDLPDHMVQDPQDSSHQTNGTPTVVDSSKPIDRSDTTVPNIETLRVVKLSATAVIPTRATPESAGYDLYSAETIELQPNTLTTIRTDLSIRPPPGTYCQVLPRSGLLTKHGLETKAGTIDRDYTGNVLIVMKNTSPKLYTVNQGDRIAQLLIYRIAHPVICEANHTHHSIRGDGGFGSTGIDAIVRSITDLKEQANPFNIWLSTDPFYKTIVIDIPLTGTHATLGMVLQPTPHTGRIQLTDIEKGTPAARLPRWRSTIKRAVLLAINGTRITSVQEVADTVTALRRSGSTKLQCTFATISYHGIHPTTGSLALYYDQLNVIAQHLQVAYQQKQDQEQAVVTDNLDIPPAPNIRQVQHAHNEQEQPTEAKIPPTDLGKTFTLKELKQRPDWPQWRKARYKMLDSYHDQGMFSEPMPCPVNSNIHHMLWRYVLKMCGTRKARMVCDGSPRQGTVTLGHTFANSLNAPSERLFWALVAKKGLIAYGADVSNAFAEAPPPAAPLFMRIDESFKDWWENHLSRPPIPHDCTVVRVNNAIQGHPESPRLWEKLIDKILRRIGLRPTTHEPCLYHGTYDGKYTLFMRQVDDFAIATDAEQTAKQLIVAINQHLRLPIHILGQITRYNGMDIEQTKSYVKIHCAKYIQKLQQHYPWLQNNLTNTASTPIPFCSNSAYITKLVQTPTSQLNDSARKELEERMGIKFRKVMGEIMYPMIKCRPDISPHAIMLSQFMANPAEIHYIALKDLLTYVVATPYYGIHYWRSTPHPDLPAVPLPMLHSDNQLIRQHTNENQLHGYVDSDWGTNTPRRNSLTGMVIMYAGGAIGYKTKFQTVIAHSSTEAEFVAACDTAKLILFYRSLMEDVGIPQTDATVLYEDNSGALLMANAQQPTRRTRHMEIKHFALLDWVEQDLLILQHVPTSQNVADAMTKPLEKTLFYRHFDTYMGHRIPGFCTTEPTAKYNYTREHGKTNPTFMLNETPLFSHDDSIEHGGGTIRT
jgi:deoxyuridine 5'-triphosphate nucleotidohydrolase